MKILIAVDETESAHYATSVAKVLFPLAEHIILSAAELPPFVFGVALGVGASPPSDALTSAVVANAQSSVAAAEALFHGGVSEVEAGDAGLVICREAARLGVDVVVVGRETKSMVSRLFHPSVSEYVMKNAPCPVLVVREEIAGLRTPPIG